MRWREASSMNTSQVRSESIPSTRGISRRMRVILSSMLECLLRRCSALSIALGGHSHFHLTPNDSFGASLPTSSYLRRLLTFCLALFSMQLVSPMFWGSFLPSHSSLCISLVESRCSSFLFFLSGHSLPVHTKRYIGPLLSHIYNPSGNCLLLANDDDLTSASERTQSLKALVRALIILSDCTHAVDVWQKELQSWIWASSQMSCISCVTGRFCKLKNPSVS